MNADGTTVRKRPLYALFAADLISNSGNVMAFIAIPWFVLQATGSASKTGITHANTVDDEHAMANRNLLIGAGVAVGDVDGDGLPDVFLASVERRGDTLVAVANKDTAPVDLNGHHVARTHRIAGVWFV